MLRSEDGGKIDELFCYFEGLVADLQYGTDTLPKLVGLKDINGTSTNLNISFSWRNDIDTNTTLHR